ncbi:GTP-binding protein, partial [Rhizobium ruizarguesonis]
TALSRLAGSRLVAGQTLTIFRYFAGAAFAFDDSVMPQTIESINHAKAAGVPIIVAINKVDKHEADTQKVRNQLLQHEVFVESMGGEVLDV